MQGSTRGASNYLRKVSRTNSSRKTNGQGCRSRLNFAAFDSRSSENREWKSTRATTDHQHARDLWARDPEATQFGDVLCRKKKFLEFSGGRAVSPDTSRLSF